MKSVQPFIAFLMIILFIVSCNNASQWKGQAPIKKVNTKTLPIQLQRKGQFALGKGIYCSNDFVGARLNGATLEDDTISILITPENTPINESPWYAFKIWSETPQSLALKLTYLAGVKHRYYPKLSRNGKEWQPLDSSRFFLEGVKFNEESATIMADKLIMQIDISSDTLWISAQELITSKHVTSWTDSLCKKPFIDKSSIGLSRNGRPVQMLKIGESDDKEMLLILSRQHPPEVTGYLAMKAFVEVLSGNSEIAIEFRKQYNTYVIPLVNPDGVDMGHWRHNAGGIDLNRDWEVFNQPEVAAVRDFMKNKISENDGKFIAGIDFHSTWRDIYYTIDPELPGNMPGLIPDMIKNVGLKLEGYEPNISPRGNSDAKINSTSYFFFEFGAESLTYEVGDNTPRAFLKQKGELTALELMKLMIEK